jgi:tetratricopeptide (TPR) repeat protein
MSAVPTEIADVGSTAQKLSQNPAFDPMRAGLTTEDYFVWSRFDGATSLKELLLMTGFPVPHAIAIVRRLRELGAILLPGENPAMLAARAKPPAAAPAPAAPAPAPTAAPAPSGTLDDPTAEERAALAEPRDANVLGPDERELVLAMQRRLRHGDPWLLLGVAKGADKKAIKRSYFKLSKDFHPDRYYGKRLGSFAQRLNEVFEAIAHAYARLTDDRAEERPAEHGASAQAQTPGEYAAELFEKACAQEVAGAPDAALKLFDAALHVDPQARYLKRAAGCALAAKQPRVAEEYAKKAAALEPQDPSTQRILARAYKAGGRLALAEEVVLMAMQLKNENDTLAKELRSDLAEIRRLLARSQGF